ncbi:MAG: hypothetical protein H6732_11085 [Alphaproteobacteria bacterium]|nr:hypothetical protein [Alphaproteobacteria bacterium]
MPAVVGLLAACGGPTYEADVVPILRNNCASSDCHGGPEATTGLDLRPSKAYAQLVGVPCDQADDILRVDPGNPDASYLLAKVGGTPEALGGEGDPMPPPFGLGQQDLDVIRAWIAAGAPER